MRQLADAKSLSELQWAHETFMRLVILVQHNGLIGERLRECVLHMTKGTVLLEGIIQESTADARRRASD